MDVQVISRDKSANSIFTSITQYNNKINCIMTAELKQEKRNNFLLSLQESIYIDGLLFTLPLTRSVNS